MHDEQDDARSRGELIREIEDLRRRVDDLVKEAHLVTLMLAVPDLIFRLHEDGTYLDWMPSSELKPYVAPGEFLGRKIADVLPRDVATPLLKTIETALRSASRQTCEYRLLENGEWHDYEARIMPLHDHEVLAIVREVTDRKRRDEALEQSERRLFQFLEAMPVGVFVLDSGGIAYYANQMAREILGKGALPVGTGALAETYAAYLAGSDRPYPRERMPIVRALAGERSSVDDMEIRRPERTIPLEVNAAPIYDADGGIEYAIAAFSDMTERRRAEERLKLTREAMLRSERLASLGTLAAGIAHEINNPLGSILAAARNAVEAGRTPGGEKQVTMCLETIARNTKRCADIVKSVLQFSRRQPSEKQAGDLNATVERALDLIREYASDRGAGIETHLARSLPEIRFSPVEMEQVIVNLIKNAVESGEGIRVTIDTEARGDLVRLRVRDNGRGMGEEGLRHLFDPFYTTRQEEGGSGLGLSIAHGIVTDHGGTIEVTSAPGSGSEFLVSLPAVSGEGSGEEN